MQYINEEYNGTCEGCRIGACGQRSHMGPGGCLRSPSPYTLEMEGYHQKFRNNVNQFVKNMNTTKKNNRNALDKEFRRLADEYKFLQNTATNTQRKNLNAAFSKLEKYQPSLNGGLRSRRHRRGKSTRRIKRTKN